MQIKNFKSDKVSSVGVIFDYDSYHNYDFFRNLIKDMGINDNKIRFIAMVDLEKNINDNKKQYRYRRLYDNVRQKLPNFFYQLCQRINLFLKWNVY